MASASPPRRREELVEHLLQCSVCLEPFNASDRKPPLLPCHHGLCHVCLEDMAARGSVRCPVCRTPIPFQRGVPIPRQFGVDHIRVTLLEYLAQHPEGDPLTSAQRREEETCEKHVDEKLKHNCKTCKKRTCPSCVIREHKDHNSVNTAEVSESCKSEIEAACLQIKELMSAEQQAASDVSSELGALGSKEEATLKQVQAALRELATRGQQAAVTPVQYQVNTKNLPALTPAMSSYGEVFCGRDDPVPRVSEQDSPEMTSPLHGTHVGFTDEETSNEPEFECPEFQYDAKLCGPGSSIDDAGTTLVNRSNSGVVPAPDRYIFSGTRSTEALTRSTYWEVRVTAKARGEIGERNVWCEVGVAGEAAMRAFSGIEWIADCSRYAAATVGPHRRNTQVGIEALCQGRLLGMEEVAEFHSRFNQVLLGMLWDATHRRLFFIDVRKAVVLFQAILQGTESLFCVVKAEAVSHCGAEVKVELVTGGRVQMSDEKRSLIQCCLRQ